jgi:opacity protein-like surface antigen
MMRYLMFCLVISLAAFAVDAQEIRGGYVGVATGAFKYDDNGDGLGLPVSDTTSGYRVLGGFQFNSVYAIEAGFGVSGTVKESYRGFDPTLGTVTLDIEADYDIATLRFLAFAPFSNLNIFGGIGYYDASIEASFRYRSSVEDVDETAEGDDDGLTAVGGVQYELSRWAIRGEYEWFDTDNVDAQSLNIMVLFRFGG